MNFLCKARRTRHSKNEQDRGRKERRWVSVEEERNLDRCQCVIARAKERTKGDQTRVDGDVKPDGQDSHMKAATHRSTPSQKRPNCGSPLHPPPLPLGQFAMLPGAEDPKRRFCLSKPFRVNLSNTLLPMPRICIHKETGNTINSTYDLLPFEYLCTRFCWTYMLLMTRGKSDAIRWF